MAGLKGKSGPPGNMNAFKHGLAAIQKILPPSEMKSLYGSMTRSAVISFQCCDYYLPGVETGEPLPSKLSCCFANS